MTGPEPQSGPWRVFAASAVGSDHVKLGRGCEDAYSVRELPGSVIILAVADGAGSARRAAEGSRIAAETAATALAGLLSGALPAAEAEWLATLEQALDAARQALEDAAAAEIGPGLENTYSAPDTEADRFFTADQERALPLRELATTLIAAVLAPGWTAAVQVGDGALALQGRDGAVSLLTFPDGGEYANETYFVTDLAYRRHAQYAIQQGSEVQAAALFTDGIQYMAVDIARRLPHLPFWAPVFSVAALSDFTSGELEGFLHSQKVAKHTSDDKTLVIAVRDDYLLPI